MEIKVSRLVVDLMTESITNTTVKDATIGPQSDEDLGAQSRVPDDTVCAAVTLQPQL